MMSENVSKEEVYYLYRAILGRGPENSQVLEGHQNSGKDFEALRKMFINSAEFKSQLPSVQGTQVIGRPYAAVDRVANKIEYKASDDELKACLNLIRQHWTYLGKERAHFSVLTNPKFLPDQLEKYSDDFWQSGIVEANKNIKAILLRHSIEATKNFTAVELGCGVGRVTNGIATNFNKVYAYDISHEHLAIAKEHSSQVGSKNIEYQLATPELFTNTISSSKSKASKSDTHSIEPCDFFYSCIVLQHNPPPVIHLMIRAALTALKPRGVAIFQVPTYRQNYRFVLSEWLTANHANDMQMHALPQLAIFEIIESTGCQLLEITEDGWTGSNGSFISNTFVIKKK